MIRVSSGNSMPMPVNCSAIRGTTKVIRLSSCCLFLGVRSGGSPPPTTSAAVGIVSHGKRAIPVLLALEFGLDKGFGVYFCTCSVCSSPVLNFFNADSNIMSWLSFFL